MLILLPKELWGLERHTDIVPRDIVMETLFSLFLRVNVVLQITTPHLFVALAYNWYCIFNWVGHLNGIYLRGDFLTPSNVSDTQKLAVSSDHKIYY